VNDGGMPNYYLPETTGGGCAFLDYDSDGWMDIDLVNCGACDFYTPGFHCATRSIGTTATARSLTLRKRRESRACLSTLLPSANDVWIFALQSECRERNEIESMRKSC